jgi:hypothetical protein
MTRRSPNSEPRLAVSATPTWPPTCPRCGFTGAPGPTHTPYAACGGDQTKHTRPPVGAS